jgi:hypothetical protein
MTKFFVIKNSTLSRHCLKKLVSAYEIHGGNKCIPLTEINRGAYVSRGAYVNRGHYIVAMYPKHILINYISYAPTSQSIPTLLAMNLYQAVYGKPLVNT